MRPSLRGLLAASLSLAALAACTDRAGQRAPDPTAPNALLVSPLAEGMKFRARGAGTITIATAQGTVTSLIPSWTSTATMAGGIALQDPAPSPLGALAVAKANRMLMPSSGGVRYTSFIDELGNDVEVAWIFAADGGPLRAVQTFVNGDLTMVTDYYWVARNGGWTLASSTRRTVTDGAQKGAVIGSASGVEVLAMRSTPADAISHFAAKLGRSFLPGELEAQILSGPCRTEWLEYIAATAALSAALSALERNPTNLALIALSVAAAARATIAELRLWICQQNAIERSGKTGLASGTNLPPLGCLVQTYTPTCDQGPPMTH